MTGEYNGIGDVVLVFWGGLGAATHAGKLHGEEVF